MVERGRIDLNALHDTNAKRAFTGYNCPKRGFRMQPLKNFDKVTLN